MKFSKVMGVPSVLIHFHEFLHEINHPAIGVPQFVETTLSPLKCRMPGGMGIPGNTDLGPVVADLPRAARGMLGPRLWGCGRMYPRVPRVNTQKDVEKCWKPMAKPENHLLYFGVIFLAPLCMFTGGCYTVVRREQFGARGIHILSFWLGASWSYRDTIPPTNVQ